MVPPVEEVTVSLTYLTSCHLCWIPHLLTRPCNSSRSLLPQTLQDKVGLIDGAITHWE
jgi:hypothetical protein